MDQCTKGLALRKKATTTIDKIFNQTIRLKRLLIGPELCLLILDLT